MDEEESAREEREDNPAGDHAWPELLRTRPFRPGDSEESAFVRKRWLTSYKDSDDARTLERLAKRHDDLNVYAEAVDSRPVKSSPAKPYYAFQEILIGRLLEISEITIATTSRRDDEDLILGWRAVQGDLLHYVYVEPSARRHGIARFLVKDLRDRAMVLTHWSDACEKLTIPAMWRRDRSALKQALRARR